MNARGGGGGGLGGGGQEGINGNGKQYIFAW